MCYRCSAPCVISRPKCCRSSCSSGSGVLTAGSTGGDAISYTTTLDIPFGATTASAGCVVAHATNTPYFVVTKCGQYTLDYQVTADNPAVAAGQHIDQTVQLTSVMSGVLDTIHFTDKNQTVRKRLILTLQAGDSLYLHATQPQAAEMHYRNQTITITKIC